MTLNMTVSPDFSPDKLAGWFVLNTWLQRRLDTAIHLEMHDTFDRLRRAVAEGRVDLIYANPADAAMLVRKNGFIAVAQPLNVADEAIVIVNAASPARCVEDLKPGIRVASTADPDIDMMGMIMLEPADLSADNVTVEILGNHTLVAKALINGKADVGILPARAYDSLSNMVRASLRPLVRSEISVVRHVLLAGQKAAGLVPALADLLVGMAGDEKGGAILRDLGFLGWEKCSQEDVEFMIDLVDTLMA